MTGKNIIFVVGLGITVSFLGLLYWYTATQLLIADPAPQEGIDRERAFDEQLVRDGYQPPTGPPPSLPSEDINMGEGDGPGDATTTPTVREQLATIMQQIEANTALRATAEGECRLLPLGNAPCGGPAFYHVYAERNSNVSALETLAAEHRELASTLNQAEEVMGICVITPEPTLALVDGECTALLE